MRPGEQRQAIRSKRERRNRVLVATEGLNDGVGSAVPHVDQVISPPGHQVTPVAAGCEGKHLRTKKNDNTHNNNNNNKMFSNPYIGLGGPTFCGQIAWN